MSLWFSAQIEDHSQLVTKSLSFYETLALALNPLSALGSLQLVFIVLILYSSFCSCIGVAVCLPMFFPNKTNINSCQRARLCLVDIFIVTVCVYMYVCMYLCMYVCNYVCVYVCLYVCMTVCMTVCMYGHI